ncbi:MAG: dockerin type I domain-containing protein [Clostridiales bacterium]|jgi:hypothetical protein|nr:dockerin type I domain-containing protein [Clostridiales bacterium]
MNKRFTIILAAALVLVLAFSAIASAEYVKGFDKNLELYPEWIGLDAQGLPTTMPIFSYTADGYINEVVYVEVPCDTDRDGKRDRVSLWIRRPVTKEGFLCPVVMEFSPYHDGTRGYGRMSDYINSPDLHLKGLAESFQYKDNSAVNLKINPDTTHLTYDDIKYKGVEAWDPIWWSTDASFTVGSWYTGTDYSGIETFTDEYGDVRTRKLYTGTVPAATVPTGIGSAGSSGSWTGSSGAAPPARHHHYFVRGYACVFGQLLGNRSSEGITSTLHVEEWLSAAAACKWFAGEAKAYTTRTGTVEVKADWANGHVAMDGTSYPGTTPMVAAMAGVPGLKAIMPEANVTSWYEYYRSGGALHGPEGYGGEDMNLHSSFNFSRIDADITGATNNVIPPELGSNFPKDPAQLAYVETQHYMMTGQDRDTADYNAAWDVRNLTRGYNKIPAGMGILQTMGQQDWNVMPRHGYGQLEALRARFAGNAPEAYGTHKFVAGLSKHASQSSRLVPGKDGVERGMLKWYLMFLDHYLLGLDNQVDELMYDIYIAHSTTGVMEGYDYDVTVEEPGTIIPGTHYDRIYLAPGPVDKAGRLSYYPPAITVNHFDDMTINAQLTETPAHPGAGTRPDPVIPFSSGRGNYTPTTAANGQIAWCDDRVVGVNRTTTSYGTYGSLINTIDRPVNGRLMYISEPLTERVTLSGTAVVHLQAAPTKGVGNLTVALMEIGRKSRAAVRIESVSIGTTGSTVVFPAENGAASTSATRYTNPVGTGTTSNFKYVTWGHTDVQNPSYDGKAWFDVPETNYTPSYYYQTTLLEPGKYYDYVVELNPYNYTFEPGMRIAVMVYGTDTMASPILDAASTGGFDVKLGTGTYIDIPLKPAEQEKPVTVEVSNILAKPGAELEVTYSIKDNAFGFSALDLKIPYDNTVYTPIAVTASGALASPFFVFNPAFDTNLMRVAFVSDDNIMGDGILFTVKYKIADSIPIKLDHPLTVLPVKMQYGSLVDKLVDLDLAVKDGGLVIGIPGDVDGNGLVTPEDAMLILQMLVGLVDWTPRALLLGDINGDGVVDTTDAALILRMVVGG